MNLTEETNHLLDLINQCTTDEQKRIQIEAALQAAHTSGWLDGYGEHERISEASE